MPEPFDAQTLPPARLTALIEDETRAYRARTPASAHAHRRALAVLPGGDTRAVVGYRPYPLEIVSGSGATVRDADGHAYLDLVNNYTSLIHGHEFRPAIDALTDVLHAPVALAATRAEQVRLAELLVDRVPSVDQVRLTNSGSEANALALRIARRATGRPRALVFAHSYHSALPLLQPGMADVVTAPYNDAAAVAAALDDTVAAIFVEPFLGAGGVIPAGPGFLAELRRLADANGSLLVFDEVQALRLGPHGAQGEVGVAPDLTTMGKFIGGGFPIGAVGGPERLMLLTGPDAPERVSHSGTFNGHLFAAVAGAATLEHLTVDAIGALNAAGARLQVLLERALSDTGLTARVTRAGSILQVHEPSQAAPGEDPAAAGHAFQRALHLGLLNRGIATTPRGMIALSTATTDAQVERAASAYRDVFARIAAA